MKYPFLLLFLTVGFFARAQSTKDLDEKNGFREMKFGTPIDSFKGLKIIEESGDYIFYEKENDAKNIGDFQLETIYYGFYKGWFYVVVLETPGYSDSRGILGTLEELYGKGYQSNPYIEKYYWFGKKVTASYDENSVTKKATVRLSSKIIADRIDADKKEQQKKAKDGF